MAWWARIGTVTHSTLQMGLALSGLFAGLGATLLLTGTGLVWAMKAKDRVEIPDTVPDAFLEDLKVDTPVG